MGKYRRDVQKEEEESKNKTKQDFRKSIGACDANFFDNSNPKAQILRQRSAELAMKDMLEWLDYEPENCGAEDEKNKHEHFASKAHVLSTRVGIFDATNSTIERRRWVLEEATSPFKRGGKKTGCVFVESVCDDEELLEENFRFKVRHSPDFKGMTEKEAIADLRKRVEKYELAYQTIDDDAQSYIKIFNLSSKLLVNHVYGRMAKVIVPSLSAWNIGSRPIFLVRAGETLQTLQSDKIDVDPSKPRRVSRGDKLGPRGRAFRSALEKFITEEGNTFTEKSEHALKMAFAPQSRKMGTSISGIAPADMAYFVEDDSDNDELVCPPFHCHVMSSTMPRAVETVSWESMPFRIDELPNLNPLDKGDFAGMELEEIRERDPEWYSMLEKDPFTTRFPGGECYADLIHRLETCIIDMEQQVNMTCVVSHVSVLQVLMAYFRRSPVKECTAIEVPMHTIIKYTPVTGGGWTESMHKLCPDLDLDSTYHDLDFKFTRTTTGTPTPIWGDHYLNGRETFDSGCDTDTVSDENSGKCWNCCVSPRSSPSHSPKTSPSKDESQP